MGGGGPGNLETPLATPLYIISELIAVVFSASSLVERKCTSPIEPFVFLTLVSVVPTQSSVANLCHAKFRILCTLYRKIMYIINKNTIHTVMSLCSIMIITVDQIVVLSELTRRRLRKR